MRKSINATVLLLVSLVFMLSHSYSQTQQPPQTEESIKILTNLAIIDIQVVSKNTGRMVDALKQEDFIIYEDGVKQEIAYFSKDRLPLSVVLLFDVTHTVRPVLKQLAIGAEQALQRLKPEDEIAVMIFKHYAEIIEGFTRDRQKTIAAITRASEFPFRISEPALLNEGVYQAALQMDRAANPFNRRVIVVLNDGLANLPIGKVHSEKEAFEEVFESGSVICGLVARSWLTNTAGVAVVNSPQFILMGRLRPPGSIKKYAERTGGEVIKTGKEEVGDKLAELFDHLRTRYSLGYYPSNASLDGKFRTLRVELAPEVENRVGKLAVIKTKQGYYARKRNSASNKSPE